jgi:hypothetical protein
MNNKRTSLPRPRQYSETTSNMFSIVLASYKSERNLYRLNMSNNKVEIFRPKEETNGHF